MPGICIEYAAASFHVEGFVAILLELKIQVNDLQHVISDNATEYGGRKQESMITHMVISCI